MASGKKKTRREIPANERIPTFTIARANGIGAGTFIIMNSSKRAHCGCGRVISSNEKRASLLFTHSHPINICKMCVRRLTAVLQEIED